MARKKKVERDLVFITSDRCGWCKKAEPVVEELRKDGFTITSLDMTIEEEAKRANEIKEKHSAQCGTPLFIDAVTGNSVCGFKEKDVLTKWANGEEIPKPAPRQQQPKPSQLNHGTLNEGVILSELLQPYKLYVGQSKTTKGYGVFAADNISGGEIIEEAPFSMTNYRSKDLVHPELRQMLYTYPCKCETCTHRGTSFILAGGFIMTYNHNEVENISFTFLRDNRIIRVTALKDIPEGAELFKNYGSNYTIFDGIRA